MSWFKNIFGESQPRAGIKESGIGLMALSTFGDSDEEPQNVPLQQRYENAYNNFPIVSAAIDITCEQVVQNFFYEGPNAKKLTKLSDDMNLGEKFYRITKCMLKNGNCWVEFPKDKKGQIKEVKILDPRFMTTYRTKVGDVIGHSQDINGASKVLWGTTGDSSKDAHFTKRRPLSHIVHFKFNALNSDKYGTSLIHPTLTMLDIKDQIESDTRTIVQRYAAPIIHAQVGDEMHPPTEEDVASAESHLEDIYADTEYVTSYLVKMNVLGFEGKGLDVAPILQHVDSQIISGLQVPAALIGKGADVDKAIAEVQLRTFTRHVKAIQRILKIDFEDKVIVGQKLGTNKDKLIWEVVEEREMELAIDIIRGLKKDGVITAQKANDLLPIKFHEKLPEHMSGQISPMDLMGGQTGRAPGQQDQYPYQKGANKVKDNANDPTKKRDNKTDVEIPVK